MPSVPRASITAPFIPPAPISQQGGAPALSLSSGTPANKRPEPR